MTRARATTEPPSSVTIAVPSDAGTASARTPKQVAEAFRRAALAGDLTEPISVARAEARSAKRLRKLLSVPIPEPSSRIEAYVAIFAVIAVVLAIVGGAGRSPATASPPSTGGDGVATRPATGQPAGVVTPNIVGKGLMEAGGMLLEAGFASPVRWFVEPGARGPVCTVVRQEPAAGTSLEPGAKAVLYVTHGC